jgi:hypothetical protein
VRAAIASLAIHIAAVWLIATRAVPRPAPPSVRAPIELAIQPAPTAATRGHEVAPAEPPASAQPPARIPPRATAIAPSPVPTTPSPPVADSRWLAIRAPQAPAPASVPRPDQLGGILVPLEAAQPPSTPAEPEPEVIPPLIPDEGGGFHADYTTFVARIQPDGQVKFEDRPNFRLHFELPDPKEALKGFAAMLSDWARDPYGYNRRLGDRIAAWDDMDTLGRSMMSDAQAAEAGKERSESGVQLRELVPVPNRPKMMVYVPIVGGSFDLTDLVMRLHGQDPYAYMKLQFLEHTSDLREGLAKRHGILARSAAVKELPAHLAQVWSGPGDAPTRRRLLFRLWDECADNADDARRAIVDFIRANLPAGSPDAFTDDELRALDPRFRPYDTIDP